MGILVDAVSDIISVPTDEIRPVPTGQSLGDMSALNGLVNTENGMVALLDLNTLFPVEEESF